MQNFIKRILINANEGENKLKIYSKAFGVNSTSHLKDMETKGLASFMVIGYKGNEFYVIHYNQKELAYMGIDIETEQFLNGLKYAMEQRVERINEIKNRISVSNEKKEELLTEKQNDTITGYHITFSGGENVYREYYLIENKDNEKFVLTKNGFVSRYNEFCDVMKEIYGENININIRQDANSHLLAICRLN